MRMSGTTKMSAALLLGFVILAVTIAYLGRYGTTATGEGGNAMVFVTDRWTGQTWMCRSSASSPVTGQGGFCIHVYPPASFY